MTLSKAQQSQGHTLWGQLYMHACQSPSIYKQTYQKDKMNYVWFYFEVIIALLTFLKTVHFL